VRPVQRVWRGKHAGSPSGEGGLGEIPGSERNPKGSSRAASTTVAVGADSIGNRSALRFSRRTAATAPAVLRADRRYQISAAHFYAGQFDKAGEGDDLTD
jgi:hypothetical protein